MHIVDSQGVIKSFSTIRARHLPDNGQPFLNLIREGLPTIREVTREGQILSPVLPALIVVALFACHIPAHRAGKDHPGGIVTLTNKPSGRNGCEMCAFSKREGKLRIRPASIETTTLLCDGAEECMVSAISAGYRTGGHPASFRCQ
jgi:hypothetical protein